MEEGDADVHSKILGESRDVVLRRCIGKAGNRDMGFGA